MIKVMIIDDSALVRTVLKSMLESEPDIKVVATVSNPYYARNKIKKLDPDVITLDVEMPYMDGLTFLEKLMKYKPIPVVMISSYTENGAETTLKALALGAVDYVFKPKKKVQENLLLLASEIISKVRIATEANVKRIRSKAEKGKTATPVDQLFGEGISLEKAHPQIICIGASTGGIVAIESILSSLPPEMPGIIIVQHMPAEFTLLFAERVNALSKLEVLEGTHGMRIHSGQVIIAPGGHHILMQKNANGYYIEVKDGPPVNRHKPSIDVLFRSAANTVGSRAVGVLLTGMGNDGASGLRELKEIGSITIAQDEQSSIIFGMPKAAIELDAADVVLSLDAIPSALRKITASQEQD